MATQTGSIPPPSLEQHLTRLLQAAVQDCYACNPPVSSESIGPTLEVPPDASFGDMACTISMKLARTVRQRPLDIAHRLTDALRAALPASPLCDQIDRVEVKPPGFMNLFLSHAAACAVIDEVQQLGNRFGSSAWGHGQRIVLEFVSANPTGPLSIAHGRQAAVGDALGRILRAVGCEVSQEYLLNDEGLQMDLLGASLQVRYREALGQAGTIPEGGYHGTYLTDTAHALVRERGDAWLQQDTSVFTQYAIAAMLAMIRDDLQQFHVTFDQWISQRALREAGAIDRAIGQLTTAGRTYEADGALWFTSTAYGDHKDRVLRKHDGSWTYFAPDIAYHWQKLSNATHRAIDLWGPDHHGYVPRLTGAVEALTGRGADLMVLIVQLVTLFRHGTPVPMSTRQGQFIALRELIDEIGADAARFTFLTRRVESHLEFDLDVAKSQSMDNPVYYVQYAHARICSMQQTYAQQRAAGNVTSYDPAQLREPEMLALLRRLRQFPYAVNACARQNDPSGLTAYLRDLAGALHTMYAKHRVVSDDVALTDSRIALMQAVRQVLANGLQLLGVSAPTLMERTDAEK